MSKDEGKKASNKRRHSDGSHDVDCTNSLVRVQNCLALVTRQPNVSNTTDEVYLGENLENHKRPKKNKELDEKDVTGVDLVAETQADDKTLLNVIETIHRGCAFDLLKENLSFPCCELDRALILASRQGLKYHVQKLVGLGANVEVKDPLGNTPLLICAENCFIDIVSFLLTRKADVNAFNSSGDTALILSMRASGSTMIVKILLAQDRIDISHQNRDGYTALMRAVEVKDVSSIKMLMDEYYNIDLPHNHAVNCKGETAQQIAARCGLEKVVQILNKHDRKVLPLVVAAEACDTETFNILLDCQFVDEREMKISVRAAFRQIFKNYQMKKVITIGYDDILIIRRLLECGAVVDTVRNNNELVVAVEMGNYQLVELLCQYLDRRQQHLGNKLGTLVLEAAAKTGRCDLIKLLIQYQANIKHNNYPDSPLDCALIHGHVDCAQLLVQLGARMDIKDALVSAVKQQVPEYMNFLFHNYKPDILDYAVKKADHLNNLLLQAVREGNLEIIGHLLDAGADINYESFSEDTPLGKSKNGEVARFLVSRGANVNNQIHEDKIPVLNALLDKPRYSMEVVQVLLDSGSSVNAMSSKGTTPITVAASNEGDVAALNVLLDHGVGFNDQDGNGNTALMKAISEDCRQNVDFLLQLAHEKKYCLNVQNWRGFTALMYAVLTDNSEAVKMLVDLDADVNIENWNGDTALSLALTDFSEDVMTTLIRAGSDVNCQNNDGFTPLMIATKNYSDFLISLLLDLGADVNAVSKKDNTKTALSFLGNYWYPRQHAMIACLKILLERGANSSYISPIVLQRMITQGPIADIPELIKSGLCPADFRTASMRDFALDRMSLTSPLCLALLSGNVSMARYFVGNLFLTNSDVSSLAGDKAFRCYLEERDRVESLNFLDEFSSQPMSLFQLTFVSVSSAVGTSPGRETRVNLLPLPEVIKEKLLFKSEEVTLSIPAAEHNATLYRDMDDTDSQSQSSYDGLFGFSNNDSSD